jgi:hypothetical protein
MQNHLKNNDYNIMEKPTCQYCSRSFFNKPNMLAHQRKAKYCLEIQEELREKTEKQIREKEENIKNREKITMNNRTCKGCSSLFTSIRNLNSHLNTCLIYQLDMQKQFYERLLAEKDKVVQDKNNRIDKLELIIHEKDLVIERTNAVTTKSMEKVSIAATQSAGNKTINVQNTNNINFDNVEPFTRNWIESKSNLLTDNDVRTVENIASFFGNEVMTNVCSTDRSRKKVAYKNEDGDIKIENLRDLLVKTINVMHPKIIRFLEPVLNQLNERQAELQNNNLDPSADQKLWLTLYNFKSVIQKISGELTMTKIQEENFNNVILIVSKLIKGKNDFNDIPENLLLQNEIRDIENNNYEEDYNDSEEESLEVEAHTALGYEKIQGVYFVDSLDTYIEIYRKNNKFYDKWGKSIEKSDIDFKNHLEYFSEGD